MNMSQEFKSLEASADSIAELLTVQEAENGVPPQQGTSGFDNVRFPILQPLFRHPRYPTFDKRL